ncbi:MAG: hypothetical protein HYV63_29735 [Candidatus Schekmanbacteria bacterium]|nr:hypothetical protein [Candidatus Schekmanbacteria bacterium]
MTCERLLIIPVGTSLRERVPQLGGESPTAGAVLNDGAHYGPVREAGCRAFFGFADEKPDEAALGAELASLHPAFAGVEPPIPVDPNRYRFVLLCADTRGAVACGEVIRHVLRSLAPPDPNRVRLVAVPDLLPESPADCQRGIANLVRLLGAVGNLLRERISAVRAADAMAAIPGLQAGDLASWLSADPPCSTWLDLSAASRLFHPAYVQLAVIHGFRLFYRAEGFSRGLVRVPVVRYAAADGRLLSPDSFHDGAELRQQGMAYLLGSLDALVSGV